MFGEFHSWAIINHVSKSRGKLVLEDPATSEFTKNLVMGFNSIENCRCSSFDEIDDESYLHDGMPLPNENKK